MVVTEEWEGVGARKNTAACVLLPSRARSCSLFRLYAGSDRLSNALFGLTDMNNRGTFTLINFRVSPVCSRRINHSTAAPTAATHGTTTRDRRPISFMSQTIAATHDVDMILCPAHSGPSQDNLRPLITTPDNYTAAVSPQITQGHFTLLYLQK